MENKAILLALIVAWGVSLLSTLVWARTKQLSVSKILCSQAIPIVVVLTMSYIFLICEGATVAQLISGSKSGMSLWSLWFHLWPLLLILTLISGFSNLVWTIVVSLKKPDRVWLPVSITALVMSLFAFFTVAINFPDA